MNTKYHIFRIANAKCFPLNHYHAYNSYRLLMEVAEIALLCPTVWFENKCVGVILHLCLVLTGILWCQRYFFLSYFSTRITQPIITDSLSLSLKRSFCNQGCQYRALVAIPPGALAAWSPHAKLKWLHYLPFCPIHVVGHWVAFKKKKNVNGCTYNFRALFSFSEPAFVRNFFVADCFGLVWLDLRIVFHSTQWFLASSSFS